MLFFGCTPEMMEAAQASNVKIAKEKAEHDAAQEAKSPEEKLKEALASCAEAGKKLPLRLLGVVDRETGKLVDQYPILKDHVEQVSEIVMDKFLDQLDILLIERGLLEPDESEDENEL